MSWDTSSILPICFAQRLHRSSSSFTDVQWIVQGTASGPESCNGMSGVSLPKADTSNSANATDDDRSKLFVTRYILAPGAPFNPTSEGREVSLLP